MRVHSRVVDHVIGFGRAVTQVRVLIQAARDNTGNGVTNGAVLGNERQSAVLNLLQHILLAVGAIDLGKLFLLANGGVVPLDAKLFYRVYQPLYRVVLRLGANVVVTGVVPAAVV